MQPWCRRKFCHGNELHIERLPVYTNDVIDAPHLHTNALNQCVVPSCRTPAGIIPIRQRALELRNNIPLLRREVHQQGHQTCIKITSATNNPSIFGRAVYCSSHLRCSNASCSTARNEIAFFLVVAKSLVHAPTRVESESARLALCDTGRCGVGR